VVYKRALNPNTILSTGTKVVLRGPLSPRDAAAAQPAGTVGVIVKSPLDQSHSYRVRFVDGSEAPLRRTEFTLLREVQADAAGGAVDVLEDFELHDYVIYRCIVGSRAYGLAESASDTDRRGIYLPPAEMHWSLYGVPEQLENPATEEAYWEFQKFLVLALKANPNVLECLYTPLVEYATPLIDELRAMRAAFLSRLVYQTYNGYVLSQFKKLDVHLSRHGTIKWKHAMHLIRLLLSGITALRAGYVPVSVEEHRDRLLAIRSGTVPWTEINVWRLELHRDFDAAYAATKLPQRPDYEKANALLIRGRRQQAGS
jgi:predicted nucleotidyltransferase